MEEDNTQYFNDEWNLPVEEFIEKYVKVIDENGNKQNMVLRDQDKWLIKQIKDQKLLNTFRQLVCQCSLPRPNSFTGNCINCNKIIKPIIDKDVNKHTK